MYDIIIIGAGPAGMTAAIYAARKQMNLLVISDETGGQALYANSIDNYPGFRLISGYELAKNFEKHMEDYNVEPVFDKAVSIDLNDRVFTVKVSEGASYESRTVILATGKVPRDLGVPGEDDFKGKGVAYCATCDAPMYAGEDVVIAGTGNAGLQAAIQLAKIARKVYVIDFVEDFYGDKLLVNTMTSFANVEVMLQTKIIEIKGSIMMESAVTENLVTGEMREIPATGIFISIGSKPNTAFVPDFIEKAENGEIKIDCANTTNVPGFFAAGDATTVPGKQIIIAAGEGAKALLSAYNYLIYTFPHAHKQ
ncbi:MAG: NAD(P)/FAD-dependent oxidoreductase [Armatimonadota bacterium]